MPVGPYYRGRRGAPGLATSSGDAMGLSNGFSLSVAIVIAVGCGGAVLHDTTLAHGPVERAAADEARVFRR